ncbi:MAG: hypothetical protein QMD14_06150, partial [Candidatus Aenigmarchaeota archaeon]|nr:hypothetical protein [Candidatus Aenigmarchaeota archaeon]
MTGTISTNNLPLKIGDLIAFNGIIDEVRISNMARSDKCISTTYNNQNSPSTFYSVGNEEYCLTVGTSGTQTASMNIPSTDQYVGGAFTFVATG